MVERQRQDQKPNPYLTPDTRHPIALSSPSAKEHRAVMLQHLETIQVIHDRQILLQRLPESYARVEH